MGSRSFGKALALRQPCLVLLPIIIIITALWTILAAPAAASPLRVGFYKASCPSAELIVRKALKKAMSQDPGIAASLIRLHFHDCFVRGCDGSVLLDSTPGNPSEKENMANKGSLRGFEVIDEAKAQLEARCPRTVSCSDILAFAARDSAFFAGGINYAVPAGRFDGRVSIKDEPSGNLPPPFFDAKQLQENFARKGLSLDEMVTLSGAHSIGDASCSSFSNRLYSFNVTHPQDPSMDPNFAAELKKKCPAPPSNSGSSSSAAEPEPTAPLDSLSPDKLDNKYYVGLKIHRGLLTSDQTLSTSPSTASMVENNARNGRAWAKKFAAAMVKMGSIDVLTGSHEGEIRMNCRIVN